MSAVTITRHGSHNAGEYHAHIAGETAIGRLTWVQRGDVRIAEHTLVPAEIGGRRVAAELVAALVDDARTLGFRIDPACSYVAAAFRRHPEWAALRAQVRRDTA
ncbi:GNAT family N-acetyltransferase [Novosphingobium aquiterrae]|uniref:GNAT family N-acetyltransferase n=1 Tax=Novosphingobium aquiterrae TaxID=624388 RepID=A0ABV6PIQ1_9SPHN